MQELTLSAAADFSQQQVQQKVAYALMAKQLDMAKQQAAATLQMVQAAGRLGKAAGRGQILDVLA